MRPHRLLRCPPWTLALLTLALAVTGPAGASGATDGAWNMVFGPSPPPRFHHAAAYDSVRDRMIVLGGSGYTAQYLGDVWACSMSGAPAWTQLAPTGTSPSGRTGHTVVYDVARDRLLLFGGSDDALCNDVWALSLSGTPAWTQLTPTGSPPGVRIYHAAVYDAPRDRMLVFGGYGMGGTYFNDVWALSLSGTPTWTQLTPSGTPPAARGGHSLVYDSARDRLLLFGGHQTAYYNDTWALSLAGTPAWTKLSPVTAPPATRYWHGAVYDPVRDRMVVFAGSVSPSPSPRNDTWALSLAGSPTWTQLTPTGTLPAARLVSGMIYDPPRDRMVLFGGYNSGSDAAFGDTWALTFATLAWVDLSVPPGHRAAQGAAYAPLEQRMVVFGGLDWSQGLADLWTMTTTGTPAWEQGIPAGRRPSARYGHSALYDPGREQVVVYGRTADGTASDTLWMLSLPGGLAWTPVVPTSYPAPTPRSFHSAVYDPVRDRMVMFGGQSLGDVVGNDVWALSLAGTPAWTDLAPTGTPPSPRYGHSAIYDPGGDRMLVFGGFDETTRFNDLYSLSLSGTPAWTQLTPTGTPPGMRQGHAAIYDPLRTRMVVYGGYDNAGGTEVYYGDVRALSLAGPPAWTELAPTGTPPSARAFHTAVYDSDNDRMIAFGGYGPDQSSFILADVWTLDWDFVTGLDDTRTPLPCGLRPPRPNPATGATSVSFAITQPGRVRLGIYDVSGRLVRQLVDGARPAGEETSRWDGMDESGTKVETGVYFVRLTAPGLHAARRVVVLQ